MNKLKRLFSSLLTLFLFLSLPAFVYFIQETTRTITQAAAVPANISIDASLPIGQLPDSVRWFSQGGEEPVQMFQNIVPKLQALRPKYIRIDHLYDFYDVVKKEHGQLVFDFSKLDRTVDDILATGALPFLSLSYMPAAISNDGTILGDPNDWNDWTQIVFATITHYSGHSQKNVANVYYEVWNEPDLFGRYTIGESKDYRVLYEQTAQAAQRASDTNPYFFGGPAITHPDQTWLDGFLSFVQAKNLRLDFLSYHRYSSDPNVYEQEAVNVRQLLSRYPKYRAIPIILSEWGPDSEINDVYDYDASAAFTAFTAIRVMDKFGGLMTFGVKDGPSPTGREFWGRWGLLSHDTFGANPKPRYYALRMLTNLTGERLKLSGEGTFVDAVATRDNGKISLMLANYDGIGKWTQAVPIAIKNMTNGAYGYKEYGLTNELTSQTVTITNNTFDKSIVLPPYGMRLVELIPLGLEQSSQPIITNNLPFDSAQSKQPTTNNIQPTTKLELYPPAFSLTRGNISFSLMFTNGGRDAKPQTIFTLPIQNINNKRRELAAKKQLIGFGQKLVLGIFEDGQPVQTVSTSITSWNNEWHSIDFRYGNDGLFLLVDGKLIDEKRESITIGLGTVLKFDPFDGAIDDLRITDGTNVLTEKKFGKRK